MNRMFGAIILLIALFLTLYGVGHVFFLGSMRQHLAELHSRTTSLRANLEDQTDRWNTLGKKGGSGQTPKKAAASLLIAGKEGRLPGSLLALARAKRLDVDSFEYLPSYFVKGSEQETPAMPALQPDQQLPELDEQGMPVGAMTESDEPEWAGFEVLPVQVNFMGTYRKLGEFISAMEESLPLFSIRRCLFTINESGIAKGQLVLVFPVLGGKPPLGMAGQGRSGL